MKEISDIIKNKINGNKFYDTNRYSEYDTIDQFPIIDKEIVLKNYADMVTPCDNMITVQTSGSTGISLKIPWNSAEYYSSLAALWRLRKKHNIIPTDTYLTCHAFIDGYGKYINSKFSISANEISISKINLSEDDIIGYLKYVNRVSPRWIYAQPSFVYYLGNYLEDKYKDLLNSIEYIELVGELLTPEIKASIKKLFKNAEVINMYGMQEFNGIMYENNDFMEEISENVYVEILKDDGSVCDFDEEGHIVVSGLKNSVLPLIRYNTGDLGRKIDNGKSPSFIITSGRSNDYLISNGKYYDGSFVFVSINEYNKTHMNKIIRFQVVYDNNTLNYHIKCVARADIALIEEEIVKILKHLFEINIPVRVVLDDNYQYISGDNKIKYFINNQLGR